MKTTTKATEMNDLERARQFLRKEVRSNPLTWKYRSQKFQRFLNAQLRYWSEQEWNGCPAEEDRERMIGLAKSTIIAVEDILMVDIPHQRTPEVHTPQIMEQK